MKNIINKLVFGSLTVALSSCIVTMRISIPTHMKLLICQRMDMLWDLP